MLLLEDGTISDDQVALAIRDMIRAARTQPNRAVKVFVTGPDDEDCWAYATDATDRSRPIATLADGLTLKALATSCWNLKMHIMFYREAASHWATVARSFAYSGVDWWGLIGSDGIRLVAAAEGVSAMESFPQAQIVAAKIKGYGFSVEWLTELPKGLNDQVSAVPAGAVFEAVYWTGRSGSNAGVLVAAPKVVPEGLWPPAGVSKYLSISFEPIADSPPWDDLVSADPLRTSKTSSLITASFGTDLLHSVDGGVATTKGTSPRNDLQRFISYLGGVRDADFADMDFPEIALPLVIKGISK